MIELIEDFPFTKAMQEKLQQKLDQEIKGIIKETTK